MSDKLEELRGAVDRAVMNWQEVKRTLDRADRAYDEADQACELASQACAEARRQERQAKREGEGQT